MYNKTPLNSDISANFSELPKEVVIHGILLPFFDFATKLELRALSRYIDHCILDDIFKSPYVKKELLALLAAKYQEKLLLPYPGNKTVLITFFSFQHVEQAMARISYLWEFNSEHNTWSPGPQRPEDFREMAKQLFLFHSLLGRKIAQLGKDQATEYVNYRSRWKEVVTILLDLSQPSFQYRLFTANRRQHLEKLKEQVSLTVIGVSNLVAMHDNKQIPQYLKSYQRSLLELYHHIQALLAPNGPAYLQANSTPKTPIKRMP